MIKSKIIVSSVLLLSLFMALFSQCARPADSKASGIKSPYAGDSVLELPLPPIPDSIKDPVGRANFVVERFWDEMDFSDTLLSCNKDFLEQNFANYIGFSVYADTAAFRKSVASLLKKASAQPEAYRRLTDVADLYLYNPDSPMLNEELYLVFLQEEIKLPFPDEAVELRRKMQLEDASKNRPGMKAADFAFVTTGGKKMKLSQTPPTPETLMIFYNPDCDNCREVMAMLASSPEVNAAIEAGDLTVVAIHSGEDKDFWKETADELPSNWIVGFEEGLIDAEGLYSLRASPTMYLLDAGKRVLIKDVRIRQLLPSN